MCICSVISYSLTMVLVDYRWCIQTIMDIRRILVSITAYVVIMIFIACSEWFQVNLKEVELRLHSSMTLRSDFKIQVIFPAFWSLDQSSSEPLVFHISFHFLNRTLGMYWNWLIIVLNWSWSIEFAFLECTSNCLLEQPCWWMSSPTLLRLLPTLRSVVSVRFSFVLAPRCFWSSFSACRRRVSNGMRNWWNRIHWWNHCYRWSSFWKGGCGSEWSSEQVWLHLSPLRYQGERDWDVDSQPPSLPSVRTYCVDHFDGNYGPRGG